jgi:hypothetical protein
MIDYFLGLDLGLAAPVDGTMIPFLVSGLLGLVTITMVLVMVKERPAAQRPS